jgi:hypothetical protein
LTALAGIAVDVISLFMALLSSRGISTPSLQAQGAQRRSSYFNNRRDIAKLEKRADSNGGTQKYRNVIIERLILAVLFVFGGFFVALNAPDDKNGDCSVPRLSAAAACWPLWEWVCCGLFVSPLPGGGFCDWPNESMHNARANPKRQVATSASFDRRSEGACLRWLRQAGAILCCSIAVIFGPHFPAYGSHKHSILSENRASASISELEILRSIENINVVDPSPCENNLLTIIDWARPGRSPDRDIALESEGHIRNNYPLSWHLGGGLKSRRILVLTLKFPGYALRDLARWSLSGVGYLNFNDKCVASIVREEGPCLNTKIGPQLRARGLRLVSCDENEPSGNNRQENCRDASNCSIVGFKEFADIQNNERRYMISCKSFNLI